MTPKEARAIEIHAAAMRIMMRDTAYDEPHRTDGLLYRWDWSRDNIRMTKRLFPVAFDVTLEACGIVIWIDDRKVFNVESIGDEYKILRFWPGDWEEKIFAAAPEA